MSIPCISLFYLEFQVRIKRRSTLCLLKSFRLHIHSQKNQRHSTAKAKKTPSTPQKQTRSQQLIPLNTILARGLARIRRALKRLHLGIAGLAIETEVGFAPSAAEDKTGMHGSESDSRDGDHGGFENHEGDFHVGDGAVETLGELGNTVDGSDEDCEGGNAESCERELAWLV